jgi:hypothetical protein
MGRVGHTSQQGGFTVTDFDDYSEVICKCGSSVSPGVSDDRLVTAWFAEHEPHAPKPPKARDADSVILHRVISHVQAVCARAKTQKRDTLHIKREFVEALLDAARAVR